MGLWTYPVAYVKMDLVKIVELQRVPKNKVGRVYIGDTHLEAHEYDTIYFLASFGFEIEVIRPTNTPRTHNSDFLIGGAIWEAKSPEGAGNSTIARQFHKASKQSDRMILDLRRIKMQPSKAEHEAMIRFEKSKSIKRLILITKDGRLLDIRK